MTREGTPPYAVFEPATFLWSVSDNGLAASIRFEALGAPQGAISHRGLHRSSWRVLGRVSMFRRGRLPPVRTFAESHKAATLKAWGQLVDSPTKAVGQHLQTSLKVAQFSDVATNQRMGSFRRGQ